MNSFRLLLSGILLASASMVMAQGAKNIRLNEVLTNNTASIEDEFGQREAWIEFENTSFSTYNIRGMYLTTDRSVLDPKMSVPERIKRMSVIPNGEPRTQIAARQHVVFFCNSNPAQGFPCQSLYGLDSTMVMLWSSSTLSQFLPSQPTRVMPVMVTLGASSPQKT